MGKNKRKVWKYYNIENGKLVIKRKVCPICGEGVYMAEHKDRWSCGRCGYTIWKQEPKKEFIPQIGIEIKIK